MNDDLRLRLDKLLREYQQERDNLIANRYQFTVGDYETKLLELHQEYFMKVKAEKQKTGH